MDGLDVLNDKVTQCNAIQCNEHHIHAMEGWGACVREEDKPLDVKR